MQAERRDTNERDIIDALTAIGCFVRQMKAGAGFDLLVIYLGWIFIFEVKQPGKHLTALEMLTKAAIERAGGVYYIVYSDIQALDIVRGVVNMEVQTQPFVEELRRALSMKDAKIKQLEAENTRLRKKVAYLQGVLSIEQDTDPLDLTGVANGEVLDAN